MKQRPRFLAVEGADGSGKTGAVRHLAERLTELGHPVLATREPGGTPQGERLRSLLVSGKDDAWSAMSELLLMTAARVEHVERVIKPEVANGRLVISDRFIGSTIAYQGAGRGMPVALIRDLHKQATGDFWPDLTIVLDVDVETGLARSRRRLESGAIDEGRFESLDLSFHQRIRQSYLDQAAAAPGTHVVIDTSGTPEETRHRVVAAVLSRLG